MRSVVLVLGYVLLPIAFVVEFLFGAKLVPAHLTERGIREETVLVGNLLRRVPVITYERVQSVRWWTREDDPENGGGLVVSYSDGGWLGMLLMLEGYNFDSVEEDIRAIEARGIKTVRGGRPFPLIDPG